MTSTYDDVPLDQLGREAMTRITLGDKHKDKAGQMFVSAGLYLIEAKARVAQTKGMSWAAWLSSHCDVGRRRADEIIMIADGRTTIEELREKNATSKREARAVQKLAGRPALSVGIPEQSQQPAPEPAADDPRAVLLADLIRRISAASLRDLGWIDTTIRSLRDI